MNDNGNQLIDLYIRYQGIFGKRCTKNQKKKFIKSLITDLKLFGLNNIKKDHFDIDGKTGVNIYVGDISRANKIICTYYDTPFKHIGNYHPFKTNKGKKNTLFYIVIIATLFILLGILLTKLIIVPFFQNENQSLIGKIIILVGYFIFFTIFGKYIKGKPRKRNLIRNTSSLLVLLIDLFENQFTEEDIAFVFLDNGCTNNSGWIRLLEVNKKARILGLDSVGADGVLIFGEVDKNYSLKRIVDTNSMRNKERNHLILFSADQNKKDPYIISKKKLNSNRLNEINMENASEIIRKFKLGE